MAFGFPTGEKENKHNGEGYRVSMPCVQAVAEGIGGDGQFLSTLGDQPIIAHLSGMSGGPVFWSTADHFGLLGVIYEGSPTGAQDDLIERPRVHYFIERCDSEEFSRWVTDLDLQNAPETSIKAVSV